MASNNTSGLVAKRYASALLDTADSQSKIDSVLKDLNDIEAMLQSSEDFARLVSSPLISREQQIASVQAIAKQAKFQDITSNFLSLLAQNRRLNMVQSVLMAIQMEASSRRGELAALVQSAFKLTAAQEKALSESLAKAVGQAVAVQVEVKEDLIGGMVVTVGSKMIDNSVKRKLERLKMEMKSGVNGSTIRQKAA